MPPAEPTDSPRLGFLDVLGHLFHKKEEEPAPAAEEAPFSRIAAELDATLARIQQRLDERRAARPAELGETLHGPTAEDRRAARERRMAEAHRQIREDILSMHQRLGTGITAADLDAIAAFLRELDGVAAAGRDSHETLSRLQAGIARKLWAEAGELAAARLVASLQREKLDWPDPIRPDPVASPEEVERARQRRLRDVREAFLALDFAKSVERIVGVIRGWQDDYPTRGSPLWEECVLEAVATGLRGRLVLEAVEILRRDRDRFLAEAESAVGEQLTSLRQVVQGGVDSIERAGQAVAATLRVLDDVVPGLAWEHVQAELPAARGEA